VNTVRIRHHLLATIALAASSRAGHAQIARPPVAGCYAFLDGAGRPASDSLYWAPATARLYPDGRAVKLTPKFDLGRGRGPVAYRWSIDDGGDSLKVGFSSGYSGTEFAFALPERSDTLHGRALEHWDFHPPGTKPVPATAVRIACKRASPRKSKIPNG